MGVLGTGFPKVFVLQPTGNTLEISLPAPSKRVISTKKENTVVVGADGKEICKQQGCRFEAKMEWICGSDSASQQEDYGTLVKAYNLLGNFILVPYSDQPYQEFVCYLTEESEILPYDGKKSHIALVKLSFRGVHLLPKAYSLDDLILCRSGAQYTNARILLDSGRVTGGSTSFIQVL